VPAPVFLDADGDDMWMLKQEERIGNAPGLAILDEPALQLEPVGVREEAQAANR
jgi:hypothetical protein